MTQSDLVIILPPFLTSNAVGLGIEVSPEYYWRGERIHDLTEIPGLNDADPTVAPSTESMPTAR